MPEHHTTEGASTESDLTVYLARLPVGEWVALEAATTATGGVGLATSVIHDEQGPVGRGLQALLVDRRR
jgi:Acyl-CoA thioesterase C-terminal domain